jgi:hypothetical protein
MNVLPDPMAWGEGGASLSSTMPSTLGAIRDDMNALLARLSALEWTGISLTLFLPLTCGLAYFTRRWWFRLFGDICQNCRHPIVPRRKPISVTEGAIVCADCAPLIDVQHPCATCGCRLLPRRLPRLSYRGAILESAGLIGTICLLAVFGYPHAAGGMMWGFVFTIRGCLTDGAYACSRCRIASPRHNSPRE